MAETLRAAEPAGVVHSDTGAAASHIDWAAIFVGALLATAVSFVLNGFGAAIGLSVVSPFGADGIGGTAMLIAVALWMIWVLVSSYMAGAYVTGRMRRRAFDATEHESDVRDGVHGLAVWALGVLFSAFLLAATVDTAARTGAQLATAAGGAVAEMAGSGYEYELNQLLRPAEPGRFSSQPESRAAIVDELLPIVERSVERGEISQPDRAYLAGVVAARTSLSEQEAILRVNQMAATVQASVEEAKDAVETARVASVLSAFVLAAALLISGAGAWWAAAVGGTHRDDQTVIKWLSGPRR
ncbi:hypothetical protein [Thalassobaculum litoreum]|uniref:Mll5186 protein n=1 Tax=Thalassobaculum litoreum DSM 18839 TaxID=1123362 RepID=A0A8G2BFB9_9PROT|nr:hypothetical protein [Thalassobaculum litoreum]SDF37415.1 hypothetical protein SAMN05660686_01057 [Thalassobaculum litoreum DSM 18839]